MSRWLPVPDFPGYEVSDSGQVRNTRTGRILKTSVWGPERYPRHIVTFSRDGRSYTKSIYRVVVETFIGPIPKHLIVVHRDGDPSHNALSNLELITRTEAGLRQVARGRHQAARKTHCPRGHEYTPENTGHWRKANGRTGRRCKRCNRERMAATNQARKGAT